MTGENAERPTPNAERRILRTAIAERKIAWLLKTGGQLIRDDGAVAVVLRNGSCGFVDVWGKVLWTKGRVSDHIPADTGQPAT